MFSIECLEGRRLLSVTWDHGELSNAAPVEATPARVAHPAVHAPSRRSPKRVAHDLAATVATANTPAGFFPIAVWLQPTYLMSHWKSVGVNTLYGYESEGGSVSLAQWNSAATANGLYTIRTPASSATADKADKYLHAYMLPDEPDLHNVNAKNLQAQYAALKKFNPSVPVIENYSGGYVLHWQGNVTSKTYAAYLAASDWDSSDIYPVTGWGLPDRLSAPGDAVTMLSKATGGKAQMAFIETSNQNLWWVTNDKGVTPGQLSAEIWTAINHGAKGITYFPQQIGGFNYDATPADVLAEMTTQNARITSLGGPLSSEYDPATYGMGLTGGLQGSWRSYNGHAYFIVTNPIANTVTAGGRVYGVPRHTSSATVLGESRTLTMDAGAFTDTFAPYETHVYIV